MTALSFGGAPGVAVLGGDLTQLRLNSGRWRLWWLWRLRDWRLRTKLTAVLLVPLLLAGVLGVLRVTDSLRVAEDLDVVAQQMAFAQQVGVVVHDLQRERQLTARALAGRGGADRAELDVQAQRVDADLGALTSADPGPDKLGSAAADAHRAALDRLSGLAALRQAAPAPPVQNTVSAYTDMVAALLDLNRAVLARARDSVIRDADAVEALTVAKEQVSQQHAWLLAAALSGDLPVEQQALLRTAESRFAAAAEEFGEAATAPQEQRYLDTVAGGAVADRQRLLDTALTQALEDEPLKIAPAEWDTAAAATGDRIRQVEAALLDDLRTETVDLGSAAWNAAIRDAVVIALLLLLAVLLLVGVVRSLLGPLRTLRTAAFDVADRRLPDAVEKLRLTADQIGETVVDPVPVYSREEVGQVARAFDTVHVQAVRLAAEQAMLRSTVNGIFLNLAGRSQRLVERQLKLIDKLETREQDPEQLSNLFQLDHLATRMRRNSENLVVLAGGELRRGAGQGVPVLDLLRAAVSEIEEYRRVTLRQPPVATVTGLVAGDLVHLIAELLDNAASAGPPDTPVTLSSALTEDGGLLVEITDSGTGLPPGELHAINERLAAPPMIDVSVSGQMGLFVVSRLAARHRIRVRLRQQRGEFGIIASVLLPAGLVSVEAADDAPPPGAAMPVNEEIPAAGETPAAGASSAAEGSATTEWQRTDGELPLQVSVVDGEQLGPSSIESIGSAGLSQPRTAEQEWLELFGQDESEPSPEPGHQPRPGPSAESVHQAEPAPAPPAESLLQSRSVPSDEPAPQPQGSEKIFDAVSAWFHESRSELAWRDDVDEMTGTVLNGGASRSASLWPPVTASATAVEWRSASDEGWYAANALQAPVDFGVTAAGLPRRQPRAHLVPGAAGPSRSVAQDVPFVPARSPEDVRGRLSSYQRGLQHGRHARLGPDEPPGRFHPPTRGPKEGQ